MVMVVMEMEEFQVLSCLEWSIRSNSIQTPAAANQGLWVYLKNYSRCAGTELFRRIRSPGRLHVGLSTADIFGNGLSIKIILAF